VSIVLLGKTVYQLCCCFL